MAYKKENKDYKLLNDEVARPLFKNSRVSHELSARVLSEILKVDYNDIYNNMKIISEDMLFSTKTVDGETDMMLETDKLYVNIEFCYTRGSTRQKQTDSYIYAIFFKQVLKTEDYKNMKNIVQIMIEDYDYFGRNEFSYEVGFMEKNLHIPEDDLITKYHISLENLKGIDYNSIKYEKDALKRILYMFVCSEDKLEEAYEGDEFMENVIKTAKEIAGKKKIPLFLPESEIRRLDNYEAAVNVGIEKARNEMILNMYKKNISINIISEVSGLTTIDIEKIINSSKD